MKKQNAKDKNVEPENVGAVHTHTHTHTHTGNLNKKNNKRISISVGILVGIMVLLGIFALIFNITNKNEQSKGNVEEYNANGTINGDKGYISSAQIIQTKTGTGPWDADDEPGNDSSEDNNIVRSFDQVTWSVDLTMALKSGIAESNLTGGIINVEASLPETCANVMKWDLESMNWIESGQVSEDGRILTGQYSMSTTETTIPGKQTLVFVLQVEGAVNNTEIIPTFNFCLEGNKENENVKIKGDSIIVSSKGKYNIGLYSNSSKLSNKTTVDYGEGEKNGRMYGYTFVVQLYNDNESKGLKGIEYPKGKINFDIELKLERSKFESTELEDITNEATPILWNYRKSTWNTSDISGNIKDRNMYFNGNQYTLYDFRIPLGVDVGDRDYSVYNSGNIQIIQEDNILHVTIDNYDFDGNFPQYTANWPGSVSRTKIYTDNIGAFSVGYMQIFVPDKEASTIGDRNYYLTVSDSNMDIMSSSTDRIVNQMNISDDSLREQHVLYKPGSYGQYMSLYDKDGRYSSVESLPGSGDGRATIGQKIRVKCEFNISETGDDDIRTANRFIKFDGEAFEPVYFDNSNRYISSTGGNAKFKVWYVTKKDGTNWASQSEMNNGNIEDMDIYENIEDIPKDKLCIGIYCETISGYISRVSGSSNSIYFLLKIKENATIGKTYGITQNSIYWIEELDRNIYTITNPDVEWTKETWNSGNRQYIKTEYDENGQIVSGTHSGGGGYGNTVLVVGANLHGNIKSVDEKNSEKVNYDLGKNENIVTYSVEPQLDANTNIASQIENVTLKAEVILPQGLTYVPGSTEYGEPEITNNSDESKTLVWYIYGVTSGQAIEPIKFKAQIDNESVNGQQYTAKFIVSELGEDEISKIGNSKIDFRTTTETINIINLASHRAYKEVETPIIEKNGQLKYKIIYENKTDESVPEFQLLDILPYNGDSRGTSFEGTYTLNSVDIIQKVGGTEQTTSNLKLYTTNSDTVRTMNSQDEGIGTDSIWAEQTIGSTINENATGIAVKGEIAGKTRLEIELTLNTSGNAPENVYANNAMAQVYTDSEQMQTGTVQAQVVNRKIQGKVWEDSNRNGVIDSSEKYLEGTVVKLLNSTNNAEVSRTTTNAQGEYEFADLAKGTYKVEVEIDDLHELTDKEIGTNREINSKFNQTTKQTDEITKLNSISAPEIIEDNVNAGIRTIQFNITTKVEGIGGNISGEGEEVYESVDKGQDSKKDIIVSPNEGYRVNTITVNGEPIEFTEEENHSVILNKFLNMQEDKEVIVTFKDVRTSVLVHHYKENTTEKLSEDVLINGEIGDSYTTQVANDIPKNYELTATPAGATGTMTEKQIVVTYYYRLKTPIVNEQSINKDGTEKIENLTDEITYNIVYRATLEDYIGEAEVTIVDTLPYTIDTASSDLADGTYNEASKTITWIETIKDINSYENKNNEITINKTIKVEYTGINQGTTNIKNIVTGKIKTKTPEKEFDEVNANETTTTEFTVNIPVSKIWEDDNNKLNQRPTKVTFKLVGSDGSEYTKELAKPGTAGSSTTQDQSDPNKWNDIFTNLPKYDENNQEIKYTLTEINGDLTYYDASLDSTGRIVTNTNKYGKVTVHYYIMNTDGTTTTNRVPDKTNQEVQDVVIEGKEGTPYTTEEAENVNEKYELVTSKLPTNASGTIEKYNEEKPQEVIYYYRLKPAKVLINYLEKDTNQVLTTQERIDGHVDDKYNTDTEHHKETITKDGRTYTLVSDSGNKTGTMTIQDITVTYYYLQNTKATVRYVARDPETQEIVKDLEEPYTQEGLVGDKFVTNEKAFIGYKLVESPENKTINMTKEEQTLIYYYEPVYTGLVENHIDDKTGALLETQTHQVQVGEDYNISSKEFAGYDLVESKLPTNASGTMGEELVTVNYYYIKKAVLEVNYIDIYTNEPLTDQIVDNTKHEGDEYTTEQKEFENYDLVEVPTNATGTMKVETDEEGNITNNRTVVTYYYTQRAIVEEHHIDILTNEDIEEPTIHNGHVGDEYDIKDKEFLSYQLIEEDEEGNSMLPENSTGTMTAEKIVVNYYYNQPAKVIVHYVEKTTGKELEELNEETGEPQSSQVLIEGFNQDEYTSEEKEFKYYTLIETPENKEGQMKVEIVEDEEGNRTVNNTIDVYYYYQAKPFNIGVEKEITGIIVNGERKEATNGKLERVEIYRKDVEKTSVQVEYKIQVINNGEVEGNVTIEDKLPEGMSLANNDGTWEEQEGVLRKIIPEINPGETKEYTVLLNWNTAENNMGEKDNVISIVDTQNVPGFTDNNDKDNTSNANVIIAVETGELPIGLILALVALVGLETVTLRYAVVLTKRQKKVNKK